MERLMPLKEGSALPVPQRQRHGTPRGAHGPATLGGQEADGGPGLRLFDGGGRKEPGKASPVGQRSGQPWVHYS